MIVSLDIETKSLTDKKEHALVPHLSKITCVGLWCPDFQVVYRDVEELMEFIESNPSMMFVGHNFKFDMKHLFFAGVDIPSNRWIHDTRLMATTYTRKIPEVWIEAYEERRKLENKKLKHGYSHRPAGLHSLKTLAPYFLGVDPFWENPEDHDSDEYVLKDCEYTYRLMEYFEPKMQEEGSYDFYLKSELPKDKMFLEAEKIGIELNLAQMQEEEYRTLQELQSIKKSMDETWAEAHIAYREVQLQELRKKYKREETIQKHIQPTINYESPKQILWLLRDWLGYDLGEEASTKVEVLEKLAKENEQIALLVDYRKKTKLIGSFFSSYSELNFDGTIYCTINSAGARTGRTSCSLPNLQQVPPALRKLFVARQGYKLIIKDASAIEPRLVSFVTEDPVLCQMFFEDRHFHSINAKIMFGFDCKESEIKDRYPKEYKIAKTVGLALMYGAGPKRIQDTAQKEGVFWSEPQCRELYYRFTNTYKATFDYKEGLDRAAAEGQIIPNIFGRPHRYPNKRDIRMKTFNTLIQSSASDLIIDSCNRILGRFLEEEIEGYFLLAIHDELIFEVIEKDTQKAEQIIDQEMTRYRLETGHGVIPLKVEGKISDHWEK